jgi:hypothetical protein
MISVTEEERRRVHTAATRIVEQLMISEEAREQAREDPEGYLVSNGLPKAAARELLGRISSLSGDNDTEGFSAISTDSDVYLDGWYQYTKRDWYNEWGVYLYSDQYSK